MVYIDVSKNRGTPQNGGLNMENPIKMDDLGVPLFLETPIYVPGSKVLFVGYINLLLGG